MKIKTKTVLLVLAMLLGGLVGCRGSSDLDRPLRVAVLPILDSLPLYVAEAEGYFEEERIDVELVAVSSAAERDQLLQAGQVDVLITDLVALGLANRDTTEIVAVRYAMVPTDEFPQFRVLAAPDSSDNTVTDLAGVPIGVSQGTVIEYVTFRLLTSEGLTPEQIETVAVPRIPDRMSLLAAGELGAATLPEPLGSLVMQQGAQLVIDDTRHREYSASIFAVSAELLETAPDAVRALLKAIDRASTAINSDKDAWTDLLSERQLVPPSLASDYRLPDFPAAAVPPESQVADVIDWLQGEGLLVEAPRYDQIVTPEYLR